MSRTELEQAACVGKHGFPTKLSALKVAKKMAGRGKGGAEAFRCPHCGQFHIGRTEPINKVERRRFEREFMER
jgi:hypothetical protein